jgi:hypothetical protein
LSNPGTILYAGDFRAWYNYMANVKVHYGVELP